jgi:hypothetical protein
LIAIELPAALIDRGSFIALDLDVVLAGLGVEVHPIAGGWTSDQAQRVLVEIEQNRVADHVSVRRAGHELFALVDLEILEAVHTEIGQQLHRVRAFDVQVRHVMRLVEQGAGFAPRPLFVSPVREFMTHDRKGVGSDLRIAQQLNRVSCGLQGRFKGLICHRRDEL